MALRSNSMICTSNLCSISTCFYVLLYFTLAILVGVIGKMLDLLFGLTPALTESFEDPVLDILEREEPPDEPRRLLIYKRPPSYEQLLIYLFVITCSLLSLESTNWLFWSSLYIPWRLSGILSTYFWRSLPRRSSSCRFSMSVTSFSSRPLPTGPPPPILRRPSFCNLSMYPFRRSIELSLSSSEEFKFTLKGSSGVYRLASLRRPPFSPIFE